MAIQLKGILFQIMEITCMPIGLNPILIFTMEIMNILSKLLKENDIDLSIAVYPWPSTLKNDTVNNKQVKIWNEFCSINCKSFYNFMPPFFNEVKTRDIRFEWNHSRPIFIKFLYKIAFLL